MHRKFTQLRLAAGAQLVGLTASGFGKPRLRKSRIARCLLRGYNRHPGALPSCITIACNVRYMASKRRPSAKVWSKKRGGAGITPYVPQGLLSTPFKSIDFYPSTVFTSPSIYAAYHTTLGILNSCNDTQPVSVVLLCLVDACVLAFVSVCVLWL